MSLRLINRILYHTVTLITQTFLAFYFWEKTNDITRVLLYTLTFFAATPIAALIAGFLGDRISPKISLLIGIWIQVGQLLLIMYLGSDMTTEAILLVGAIGGLGEGFKQTSMELIAEQDKIDESAIAEPDESQYYASQTVILTILQVLVPFSAAYIASHFANHFYDLFIIILGLLLIHAVIVTFMKLPWKTTTYNLKAVFSFPGTNRDKPLLAKGIFFEGIAEGVTITLLPIIILYFVSSMVTWGLINSVFLLLGVGMALFLKRLITDDNTKLFYVFAAFFYAAASIFFVAEFNFAIVLIFLLSKEFMDVVHETSYQAALDLIIKEDTKSEELYAEYRLFIEIIASIGRIVPIVLLLLFGTILNDSTLMRFALLTTGLLPLIAISSLGKTKIFSQNTPIHTQPTTPVTVYEDDLPSLTG